MRLPDQMVQSAPTAAPEADNLKGMGWMGVSVLGASLMTLAARGASMEISSGMIVFFRGAIILAAILFFLLLSPKTRKAARFRHPKLHVLRGSLIGLSTLMGFYTISVIPLATATVLFFTAPIFATVINIFLHKERVGPRRIGGALAGFAGAVIVLRPDTGAIEFGMLTAIGSSLFFSLALSLSRNLTRADGAVSTYISSVFFTLVWSLPFALQDFQLPSMGWTWIAVVVVAFASFTRGYADLMAYHLAEAAVLAPLTYMRLIFIGIGGYFLFQEVPDASTLVGAGVIVGSTLYITHRQAMLRRQTAKP